MDGSEQVAKSLDRIAKILVGLLLKDIEDGHQTQKVQRLKQCGFDNTEIAKMLGTSRNTINVAVHALKKKRKRSKKKAKTHK